MILWNESQIILINVLDREVNIHSQDCFKVHVSTHFWGLFCLRIYVDKTSFAKKKKLKEILFQYLILPASSIYWYNVPGFPECNEMWEKN